ncbi:hypothetical protein [Acidisoma sp. 7E03]
MEMEAELRLRRWENDLRDTALRELPIQDPNHRATLEALPIDELIVRFFNWRSRLVHPHRRSVFYAKEFSGSTAFREHRHIILQLASKIKRGASVIPHLSRLIDFGYDEDKKGNAGGRSLDPMLNEWGVHHLHLSHEIEKDGFVKRTSQLLFVIFRPKKAFVLGIFNHGDWSAEDIVVRSTTNWPRERLFVPLAGAVGLAHPISPEDRNRLRKAGISSAIELNGAVYMPPFGGITTAKTSSDASVKWMQLARNLKHHAEHYDDLIKNLRVEAEKYQRPFPRHPDIDLISVRTQESFGFALREIQSGAITMISF